MEDFDALCRQAQITYIVPVVQRPHPPGTPVVASAIVDTKEKVAPKIAKNATGKEKEPTVQQQQPVPSEPDPTELSPGQCISKETKITKKLINVFFSIL